MRSIRGIVVNKCKTPFASATFGGAVVQGLVHHFFDGDPFRSSLAEVFESIQEMRNDKLRRADILHEDLVGLTYEHSHTIPISNSGFVLGIP